MKFRLDDASTLWFSDEAVEKMMAYRQCRADDTEACGALLGRLFEENDDIAIDDVTIPQKEDVRRRTSVHRSTKHSDLAVRHWRASGHTESFHGLWHTHPENDPSPSSVDYNDWERALRNGQYPGNRLIFVIIGIEDVGVWLGEQAGRAWNLKRKIVFKKLEPQ